MTDQQIPAAEVRKIIAFYRDGASDRGGMILDALRALLPPPPRPTLADMAEEERAACKWMQADVDQRGRVVITTPDLHGGLAALLGRGGGMFYEAPADVTPRPDLPRMEWPGDKKPAPALPGGWRLADHKHYGRVIVTNPTPDSGGHVYFVAPAPGLRGNDWHLCGPDELTYIEQETTDAVD